MVMAVCAKQLERTPLSTRSSVHARLPLPLPLPLLRRFRAFVAWQLVSLTCLIGCAAPQSPAPEAAPTTSERVPATTDKALQWVLHAAEYRAAARTIFAGAARVLPELLADRTWTAALEQTSETAAGKPAAVIVDVDDTVLSSRAYQWQIASQGQPFEPATWDAWTRSAEPEALPGAVEYIQQATALNLAVFYITNHRCQPRTESPAEACPQANETRERLIRAGFPPPPPEHLLLRDLRPEWSRDKSTRRAHVASKYRIVQLIGDDLGDFIAAPPNLDNEQRTQLAHEHRALWGKGWFMLPNPMYGSWQAYVPAR